MWQEIKIEKHRKDADSKVQEDGNISMFFAFIHGRFSLELAKQGIMVATVFRKIKK